MVALNPRLSVTHNGHNTWKLHISHVQLNDSGSYMCQVNTDPMRSQVKIVNKLELKCISSYTFGFLSYYVEHSTLLLQLKLQTQLLKF
jgi:hypothetical protein